MKPAQRKKGEEGKMSVRPLDLQVSINSLMETSRDQASRLATEAQEQRTMDGHIIDDALHRQHTVNKTNAPGGSEKLEDTERHFGNKTEAESEQEYAEDDKEHKEHKELDDQVLPEKKTVKSDHIVDYLV